MNDAELRAIVRDAVARHLGRAAARPAATSLSPESPPARAGVASSQQHASHHLYVTLLNTDSACVIEPAVQCNHCGYCKSHGY